MKITRVKHCDDALLEAVNGLLPALSRSASSLNHAELTAIVESDAAHLFIAVEDKKICGMLTLVVFRIPTGIRSWIEDVVVSESCRGKGAGRALVAAAVQLAGDLGAKTIDLTSNPHRKAANRLYQSVGFERRSTNVYRVDL